MNAKCPICNQAARNIETKSIADCIECTNCGLFIGTDLDIISSKYDSGDKALLSHIIARNKGLRKEPFDLSSERIAQILETETLPTVVQKIENLINAFGAHSTFFGHVVAQFPYQSVVASIGALSVDEVYSLQEAAHQQGLLTEGVATLSGEVFTRNPRPTALTLGGWQLFEQISQGEGESNLAFMAMPFGNLKLDEVYQKNWKPAVAKAGYVIERVDERQQAGSIDDLIRTRIRQAKFLICELTDNNLGAYWEAGFAEGLGKPVIYLYEKTAEESPHFDVDHSFRVVWEQGKLDEATKLLTAVVKETMAQWGD